MKSTGENIMPRGAADTGRLGRIEFLAMNNPVRRLLQKHVEFRFFRDALRSHSIDLTGGVIIDAGCGSGYGTRLIVGEYKPSRVIAFDIMPEQIELAQKRGIGVDFFVGDMTKIDTPDNSCDAAFVFGVFHHVPDWRRAVVEVARTIKPGGVLVVEEPPYRFTFRELEEALRASGLTMLAAKGFFMRTIRGYLWRKGGTGHDRAEA
jgi:ubiquinone/menaquinone biosynthesis C-methylase UbiE